MKHFTLLFMGLCFATTSFAQSPSFLAPVSKTAITTPSILKQRQKTGLAAAPTKSAPMGRIAPYYNTLITNQPAGTLVTAQKSGVYYINTWFGIYTMRMNGSVGDYVLQDRGTIYLKQGITAVESGWLRIDKVDDTTYVCHTPQKIYRDTYNGKTSDYYAIRMTLNSDSTSYVVEKDSKNKDVLDIEFSFRDGVLRQKRQDAGEILGLANLNGQWYSDGDYAITSTPITDEKVQAPEDLTWEDFVFKSTNADATTNLGMIKVGFDGNDVYVANPYNGDTTECIKGTVDGDKVTFADSQYLGFDNDLGYHLYFFPGSYGISIGSDGSKSLNPAHDKRPLTMNYDAASRTMTCPSGRCWILNAGNQAVYYAGLYVDPVIYKFQEVAAVPADPSISNYQAYQEGTGAYVRLDIPSHDINGEYLNTNKLYYNFFVNGEDEPETLYKDDYTKALYDELTDIPYGYSDGWDIISQGDAKGFYFFIVEFDSIGFQSLYTGGGETHRSNIVWFNPNATPTSVKGIEETGQAVSDTAWYDLSGRRIAAPRQKGIFIREVTYADGSRKTQKFMRK